MLEAGSGGDHNPFNNLLGNMVQSNLDVPATTAEMIELWWKTILSYPYNPGWWQTGISQFWRSIPKFKKITYIWDKQTEKDKWYCKLFPKDDFIYEPCLEYSVEWIFIDENGNEKEFKNLKIMVWTLVNWYFEIMASWF